MFNHQVRSFLRLLVCLETREIAFRLKFEINHDSYAVLVASSYQGSRNIRGRSLCLLLWVDPSFLNDVLFLFFRGASVFSMGSFHTHSMEVARFQKILHAKRSFGGIIKCGVGVHELLELSRGHVRVLDTRHESIHGTGKSRQNMVIRNFTRL